MIALSQRLEAILQLLQPCQLLADIGTDHGYLPIAAVQRGVALRAIAADLREAPLIAAARNIRQARVGAQITAVRGNGLAPLKDHTVDALVLAGMGGHLMTQLWDSAPPGVLATVQQLVVQPNEDVHVVRAWAFNAGWHLRDERIVEERGRFFTICGFAPGVGSDPAYATGEWSFADLCQIGPLLLARKDTGALCCYEHEHRRYLALVNSGVTARAADAEFWRAVCAALR